MSNSDKTLLQAYSQRRQDSLELCEWVHQAHFLGHMEIAENPCVYADR